MDKGPRSVGAGTSPFPSLRRSRSVAPELVDRHVSAPATPITARSCGTGRSKSTTRSRTGKDEGENRNRKLTESVEKSGIFHYSFRKPPESGLGVSHRQRIPDAAVKSQRKARSATTSPSAWALSPGRPAAVVFTPAESAAAKQKSGSLSSVLRIFRQPKIPVAQKEALHSFRVLYTQYLQWRFVNARAEGAMVARKANAELRNSVVEKRIQVQKLEQEIKLRRILSVQITYLNEWEKIEKRNLEAVVKLSRAMQAASTKVPAVSGVQADVFSVYRAFCAAVDVMNRIGTTISVFYVQVEKMSSLLFELLETMGEEKEAVQELMGILRVLASLEAGENSLRVRLMW